VPPHEARVDLAGRAPPTLDVAEAQGPSRSSPRPDRRRPGVSITPIRTVAACARTPRTYADVRVAPSPTSWARRTAGWRNDHRPSLNHERVALARRWGAGLAHRLWGRCARVGPGRGGAIGEGVGCASIWPATYGAARGDATAQLEDGRARVADDELSAADGVGPVKVLRKRMRSSTCTRRCSGIGWVRAGTVRHGASPRRRTGAGELERAGRLGRRSTRFGGGVNEVQRDIVGHGRGSVCPRGAR